MTVAGLSVDRHAPSWMDESTRARRVGPRVRALVYSASFACVCLACVVGPLQSGHTGIDEGRTAILLIILVYKLYMENPNIVTYMYRGRKWQCSMTVRSPRV